MPLIGREKSDQYSILDSPKERARKMKVHKEQETEVMESVRVVDPDDYAYPVFDDAPTEGDTFQVVEPVLTEWDAYRVEGIVTLKEALVTARDALQAAEAWSKQISAVPHDALPLIRELAHKSKLVVDELKDLR